MSTSEEATTGANGTNGANGANGTNVPHESGTAPVAAAAAPTPTPELDEAAAEVESRDTGDIGGDLGAKIRAVLHAQRTAFRKAGAPTYEQRLASLDRLEEVLVAHKHEIAKAIDADFGGRCKWESLLGEVFVVKQLIEHTRGKLREWMEPEEREVKWTFLPARNEIVPQPLGVIGIISPWNYPVQLCLGPLVSALAAGNRAMIKPSELTPKTAALLETMLGKVFDRDTVAVVNGGPEVAEAFSHQPFDHLVFTGSTRVGKIVMRAAAEHLVPVTLELGGKSPAILGEDVSLGDAAAKIMMGKCFNAGQTCIAPDYVLAPRALVDRFVEAAKAAVGKMYERLGDNPDYTAIVNERHYERLQGYLADARDKGAKVVPLATEEIPRDKRKIVPTIVVSAGDDTILMQEEIFGPILPVRAYDELDEAIDYVNDHPRPLALYYFGSDQERIDRVLSSTISGGVSVNETLLHCAQDDLPFGGVGASGIGAYHAREGFDAMSHRKPIFVQSRLSAAGLFRPPYRKAAEMFVRLMMGR